ncbi:hypothetical protein ACF09H_23070 [Streptomyces sp. NPDC014983]|uniref:hypothetical protein n=1 Tax=Streptomyces sp. NPDC014983 TaxID=3364933 RepID=UPI0036F7C42D
MIRRLAEGSARPRPRHAVPGLRFCNRHVVDLARALRPRVRGESKTTDLVSRWC